jgi:hypothetical protein
MNVETIARICHGANKEYCDALGDFSQVPWEIAPAWVRDSALNGVQFRVDNPTATPEQMHQNWLDEKRITGWTYGPVKDIYAKTHPCLLPYHELPAAQRAKDYIFSAIVDACLPFLSREGNPA